jgi:hypothetical protein
MADFTKAGTPILSQDVFDSIFVAPLIQFLLAETILLGPTGGLFKQTEQLIENAITQEIQKRIATLGVVRLIDVSALPTALIAAIGTGINGFTFTEVLRGAV